MDTADAYLLLERLRWNGAPDRCPHCGTPARCYYLSPAHGSSRRTRSGARSQRRVWKCGACRRQFSVLTGTVLQGTKIDLWAWITSVDSRARGATIEGAPTGGRYGLSREAARHVDRVLDAALSLEPARSCIAELFPTAG